MSDPATEQAAVAFTVYGRPQPGGSKRAVPIRNAHGHDTRRIAVIDDNPRVRDWRQQIAAAALQAADLGVLLDGPLALSARFYLRRPRGHHGSGRNAGVVRPSAPALPITKPDTTKLLRALEDALTGIVWRDDAQIVDQCASKRYGIPERAEVTIARLETP